ncbi:MAG TPA: hypothetical protein ENK13_00215, partial [Thermopetrobacter sp.]|nr:hypothetical protein [Thermopetrobacter sp.]
SIVPLRDLKAGTVLTADVLGTRKPDTGIPAGRWHEVLGRRLRRDVAALRPLREEDLE